MDNPVNLPSRPAFSGGARAFVAARRRRRQQVEPAPDLRWDSFIAPASGADLLPDGTPVWILRLGNDGGGASGARVVLFTADSIVRGLVGDEGRLAGGERWELTLDRIEAQPARSVRGYALMQGTDGRWHATTVDGRSASFRTEPDELGVVRTLGLRMPLGATDVEGPLRSERVAPGTR